MSERTDFKTEVMEVQRSLGRIEGKLDAIVVSMQNHLIDDSHNFSEVKGRISRLETRVYAAGGIISVFALLLPTLLTYFTK